MTGSLSWLGKLKNSDPDFFLKVGNIKNSIGIHELCIGKAVRLKPFVQEIFDLEFLDTPPYFKLKHILVKSKEDADAIVKELEKDPSKFEETAKQKSIDPQTKANGGSLGYVRKADLPEAFAKVVFEAKERKRIKIIFF